MKSIYLDNTDLKVSEVGMGTSSLHYCTKSTRRKLIHTSLDLGITHFDTAPIYGNGISEKAIGSAISKKMRPEVTITSKVGFPLSISQQKYPFMTKLIKKIKMDKELTRSLDIKLCENSLNYSLKNLQTEWLDILLIHEPTLFDKNCILDLLPWLDKKREQGKIKYFGIAGENIIHNDFFLDVIDNFDIIQTDITDLQSQNKFNSKLQIGYGLYRHKNNYDYAKLKNTQILYSTRKPNRIYDFCKNFKG
jgi:aryl-alcohol dehydrogenase-like predicted oxidoreductase